MSPDTVPLQDTVLPLIPRAPAEGRAPMAEAPGPRASSALSGGALSGGTPSGSVAESLDPLLELELSLGLAGIGEAEFAAHVRAAARAAGGEMLFDLPGSGLIAGCRRVAALRIPQPEGPAILFACLEADGETVRLVERAPETEPLARFAEAFVSVVERLKT